MAIIGLNITVLSARNAQQGTKCIIRIEFNHGGFYNGQSKDDRLVAQQLERLMQKEFLNCDVQAMANKLHSTFTTAPLLDKELITRTSIVKSEQDQIDLVPNGARLFKVSYSACSTYYLRLV